MIQAMLIDDEALGRAALRKSLEIYCPNIKIVSEAENADTAKELIETLKPQLLFLDIAMPGKSGFDLLQEINYKDFAVIFVTAHDEYTIQAIRYSAVDYLLKPFDESELVNAVERVEKRIAERSDRVNIDTFMHNIYHKMPNDQMQLCIASSKGFQVIKVSDVICCEARNSYTIFYLANNQQVISSKPIGDYELLLADAFFSRIHKSWLINLKHLKEYRKGEGGLVIMSNMKELEVARRKKEFFMTEMKRYFKY
ncbi:MAG: response regulator transcription factor [Bacteroidia bacterium]|nr:response regulator transcription factor [Bacteroidia bacterium]